jgi:hypothetical protein
MIAVVSQRSSRVVHVVHGREQRVNSAPALMGGGTYVMTVTGEREASFEPMPNQTPISVNNGKHHVAGVRFIVKPLR